MAHKDAFGWCLSTFWRWHIYMSSASWEVAFPGRGWHIYMSWLFWLILRVYDIKSCSCNAFFDFNKSFLSKLAASSRSGGEIAILGAAGNVLMVQYWSNKVFYWLLNERPSKRAILQNFYQVVEYWSNYLKHKCVLKVLLKYFNLFYSIDPLNE